MKPKSKDILLASAAVAASIGASVNAMASDVVSLKFSDGRPDIVGVVKVNAALKDIGVHVMTIDAPKSAHSILAASYERALSEREKRDLIQEFKLSTPELLEQVRLAGRTPAVPGGGVMTEETGTGPYPKVYDMKALDNVTHKAVLEKYARMHVNSADDGTDIDEVMTVVSGGPFRWAFTLKDGSIARFQVEKVNPGEKAVRVSYHGLGMHAGIMDARQGLIVAYGHGPKEFTMRYQADVPHANLLGTNPWVDFNRDMPVVLDKVQ
ncbi:hypothetical protein BLA23254_02606 [Burkholderia lata]|uniref:Uncharacterized protein n=1 Tax=Burkholderia lata (strain ATCC 17760 / DSM 23089 / LMG 22485 / NCIMB 9086 / R18194 / 383) TaxID=482957 RepID=A0A6P2KQ50_BURL3|nr:hypothetical protein [Burkholderia lata]VWB56784.1 hypothetical protein BLA23254_02606 [Burkholderia lata]